VKDRSVIYRFKHIIGGTSSGDLFTQIDDMGSGAFKKQRRREKKGSPVIVEKSLENP